MMGRHLREGVKNLIRNSWMSVASVGAVAITLLILGAALLIAFNAQQMSQYVAGQLQVNVYLKQQVTKAQAQQIVGEVQNMPGIRSVQYVSKEEGFKQLEQMIGTQYHDVLGGLSQANTLPDKLIVKAANPQDTVTVAKEIQAVPGVDKVDSGQQVVNRLLAFLSVLRNIGLAFVLGLLVTAMFLISNTIKITIFSRRREIEIMKLVGATNWFIRWPFLTEAMLIGFIGAAIPFAILTLGYRSLYVHVGGVFPILTFPLLPVSAVAIKLFGVMLLIGLFVGIWGGIMSIRKFLRV